MKTNVITMKTSCLYLSVLSLAIVVAGHAASPELLWKPVADWIPHDLQEVTFGSGRFVAVGDAGLVLDSTGGVSWVQEQTPTDKNLHGVTQAQGRWIAVGESGVILSSPDAVTWRLEPATTSAALLGVASGLNRLIAVGEQGTILVSDNGGISWGAVTPPVDTTLRTVEFGGGLFVAAGDDNVLLLSTDLGETWAAGRPAFSNGAFTDLLRANGSFWATQTYWTEHSTGNGGAIRITHGAITRSVDGLQWNSAHIATTSFHFGGLAVADDLYVALDEWVPTIPSPDLPEPPVSQGFAVSLGGETWEPDYVDLKPGPRQMSSVAFGAGCFVAVGAGNTILRAAVSEVSRHVPQLALPTKAGEQFMVEDYDFAVTQNDLGFNRFSGNAGTIQNPAPAEGDFVVASLVGESAEAHAQALRLSFDFTGLPLSAFGGLFHSLLGLTDTKVSLDGTGVEPSQSTRFPRYKLNFDNLFDSFQPMAGRSIDQVCFDVRLDSGSPEVVLKIELQDESGHDVFTRRRLSSEDWATGKLARKDFDNSVAGLGNVTGFDWTAVSVLSLIVERYHAADHIDNPVEGAFLVDNIRLVDEDGSYPDLEPLSSTTDGILDPAFRQAFLDLVRARSFQYFLDFASTDPRTGGIIHDRSTFADLITVGGVGFQLSAYVIGAERGYLGRPEAAQRTRDILRVLHDSPQGPERVGTVGYQGFFYHFLGIDGLRKQNFDFTATPDVNEALNTVELSTIDTALAVMGTIVSAQYFTGSDEVEADIRFLADAIYRRVNWPFMLATVQDGRRQFYLGWKPEEERDDDSGHLGRFKLNAGSGPGSGQYSSKWDETTGSEVPATLDYYTDEALLIALLAMASPAPEHRVGREAWDDLVRAGEPFVKSWPGALFTYQFASAWFDLEHLGFDNHPQRPVDFFANTRDAILETRRYAIDNPYDRAGLGRDLWGLTAAEGPFDRYAAYAAPGVAHARETILVPDPFALEAESETGAGGVMMRSAASGERTRWLHTGEGAALAFSLPSADTLGIQIRYSNDGPSDVIQVQVDDQPAATFQTSDTRPSGGGAGSGWNSFQLSEELPQVSLEAGEHQVRVTAASSDPYGVEIDAVYLQGEAVVRSLDDGTVAPYGMAASILHAPGESISALWTAAHLNLGEGADRQGQLFHPRFGFADAVNLNIADATIPGQLDAAGRVPLRSAGAWLNPAGFAIDHGPIVLLIDNYLSDGFLPSLVVANPGVQEALATLFPSQRRIRNITVEPDGRVTFEWQNGGVPCVLEFTEHLGDPAWRDVTGPLTNSSHTMVTPNPTGGFFRLRFP